EDVHELWRRYLLAVGEHRQAVHEAVAGGGTRKQQDLARLRVNQHRLGVRRADREPEPEAGGRLGWRRRYHARGGRRRLRNAVDDGIPALADVVADVADVESRTAGAVWPKRHRLPVDVRGARHLEGASGLALLVDRVDGWRVIGI